MKIYNTIPSLFQSKKKDYRLDDDSPMISNATDKTDIGGFTHSNPTDIIEKSQANVKFLR